MQTVRLAKQAMGTRFELLLMGRSERFLHAAGEEALQEIARLEAQLSLYRPESDVSDLNRRAAHEAVPVDPRLFRLLERAKALSAATEGAFDITVAPLMRCWGFAGGAGRLPTLEEIEAAQQMVGSEHLILDETRFTVRFARPGVTLDFGAIGKGYAIEQAMELLRANEIEIALLHGGTSSIAALDGPPGEEGWPVAIEMPPGVSQADLLPVLYLANQSLSVSAPHGKSFTSEGRRYGHVMEPKTGYPTDGPLLAAVQTDSATDGDALSTALLTRPSLLPRLAERFPRIRALILSEGGTLVTSA